MYAPLKKKYIRGNNSPFMNRILSKEIMKRSRLRNKFLKSKSEADKKNYVKQRNYLCLYLREQKRNTMETQILEKLWTTEHFEEQLKLSFPMNPLKMKKLFWQKRKKFLQKIIPLQKF